MVKDQRIKDYHDLVKDLDNEHYNSLFSTHPFSKMGLIITFITNQLNKKFTSKESDPKILFEKATDENDLSEVLKEGDVFYCSLFESENIISENNKDLIKSNPLNVAINRIYNSIWDMSNVSESHSLIIYSELEKYLEQLLGKSIAVYTRYPKFSDWLKIYHITYGLWGFYNNWISNIDKKLIESNISELLFIGPSDQLHELADLIGYRREKGKASEAYENNLQALSDKSDWDFIREATDKSDMLSLNDDLGLKENLLLRIDIKSWLIWVDNLKWPILQDHAFYSIQDLATIEQIIALVVQEEPKLKTKSQYLLLIVLQNYYELLEKITSNLYHLKEGQWDLYDKKVRQDIIDESIILFDKWIASELEASCMRVFQLIFGSKPVSESKHFIGIFEWINNYSKQNYLDKRYSEPGLKTLKIINDVFENILILDPNSKIRITSEIVLEKINWQIFEKLITLFQSDETDGLFRDSLYNTYIQYIESDHFNWNGQVTYNDVVINQACYLSYLMTKSPAPLNAWHSLFNQFKCWHEGWITVNNYDYKVRRKETYVLMVGACLAYSYYSQGKKTEAKKAFNEVLEIVLSQYRVASSHNSNDYEIVLRLLSHTIAQYSPIEVDSFIKLIDEKCDDLELFLVVTYEISLLVEKSSLKLSTTSVSIIKNQIYTHFWKIEKRYSDNALKHMLKYFSTLKEEILQKNKM